MSILVTFFKFILSVILIISFASNVYSLNIQKKCGAFVFEININNPLDIYETSHVLSAHLIGTAEKHVFYKSNPGMLIEALCVKNRHRKELFIFHEQCTGNACNEDIYGVYDPLNQKLLLSPKDWPNGNGKEVEKIAGYHFKFLDGDFTHFFCCSEKLGDMRWGR